MVASVFGRCPGRSKISREDNIMAPSPLPPHQTDLAFHQLWDAVRTCELNILFHRARARNKAKQTRMLDISTTVLASIAGVGILSGITGVPSQIWAIIAFISGFLGQLRSILQLTEQMLENRRLDNEYSSVLSALNGIVSSCQEVDALTAEINGQLRLALERYRITNERDQTEYDAGELRPFQALVKGMYPDNTRWTPTSAVKSDEDGNHEDNPTSQTN
jgi:hypothetical protein